MWLWVILKTKFKGQTAEDQPPYSLHTSGVLHVKLAKLDIFISYYYYERQRRKTLPSCPFRINLKQKLQIVN